MLAEYIHTKSPKAKGWSYRTIYKMVQFYDTYSSEEFENVVSHYGMQNILSLIDKNMLPMNESAIVPIESAQIPSVLFATGWSNHQLIMSQCKTNEQRLFYMLYAGREQLKKIVFTQSPIIIKEIISLITGSL